MNTPLRRNNSDPPEFRNVAALGAPQAAPELLARLPSWLLSGAPARLAPVTLLEWATPHLARAMRVNAPFVTPQADITLRTCSTGRSLTILRGGYLTT
ncbi:hypothetical protein [Deinococcus hopiensis]|uniref:hypothetical protein n=1 Tax=Deinococcus hopiensis TaxID=309885 RepID=UPI0014828D02|nr:hypothetical protein [Deinococcus hopiensis]